MNLVMNSTSFAMSVERTLEGTAVYRTKEHSFDFIPASNADVSQLAGSHGTPSILVGTIQIEIGVESKLALFVWGYHTVSQLWNRAELPIISAHRKGLKLASETELMPGVSLRIANVNEWSTTYDDSTGWICIGSDTRSASCEYAEFANQTVAELCGGKLNAIWLRPKWL